MRALAICLLLGVCLESGPALAGTHAGQSAIGQKIICVVPMIGTGTMEDPRRPMFTPGRSQDPVADVAASLGFSARPEIISFHAETSDDGQTAIVEFVALDRAAFKEILASSEVKTFDRQRIKSKVLEERLQQFKKSFQLSRFEEDAR